MSRWIGRGGREADVGPVDALGDADADPVARGPHEPERVVLEGHRLDLGQPPGEQQIREVVVPVGGVRPLLSAPPCFPPRGPACAAHHPPAGEPAPILQRDPDAVGARLEVHDPTPVPDDDGTFGQTAAEHADELRADAAAPAHDPRRRQAAGDSAPWCAIGTALQLQPPVHQPLDDGSNMSTKRSTRGRSTGTRADPRMSWMKAPRGVARPGQLQATLGHGGVGATHRTIRDQQDVPVARARAPAAMAPSAQRRRCR